MLRCLVTFALLLVIHDATAQPVPCAGFADVDPIDPAIAPFCANVEWIKNRGITLGCNASGTLYCPSHNVTRLQMAAFMNRLGEALFPSTCATGQVMKWNGIAWACANALPTVIVRSVLSPSESGNHSLRADCEAGEKATGGGVSMWAGNAGNVTYFDPGGIPVGNPSTGWFAGWFATTAVSIRVHVVCIS